LRAEERETQLGYYWQRIEGGKKGKPNLGGEILLQTGKRGR